MMKPSRSDYEIKFKGGWPGGDIAWMRPGKSPDELPHQWYLHGEPVEVVALGVKRGESVTYVHKFKKSDGTEHDVYWVDGELPGVSYETLSHHTAGSA